MDRCWADLQRDLLASKHGDSTRVGELHQACLLLPAVPAAPVTAPPCLCLSGLSTCMDTLGGDGRHRPVQKAKMEVWLTKSGDFDRIIAAERDADQAAREAAGADADTAAS